MIIEVIVSYFMNSKVQHCTCTIPEIEMDFTLAIHIVFAALELHVIISDIQVSREYNMYYRNFHWRNDSFISGALSIEMKK